MSARNAALATFPLLTIACLTLIYALLNHEYSISYVWQTTDNATPTFYLYTALWGSQAGLLFWSWLIERVHVRGAAAQLAQRARLMPYVIVATMATLRFFLILNVFIEPVRALLAGARPDAAGVGAVPPGGQRGSVHSGRHRP